MAINLANPVNRQDPLNRGLTSWYLALPPSSAGRSWLDLCRHASGTLTNGPTWGSAGRQGGFGSLGFSAASSHHVALAAGTTVFGSSNILSVSLWVKVTGLSTYRVLFSCYTNDSNAMEIIYIPTGDSPSQGFIGGNYNNSARTSAGIAVANEWQHIVLTSDGTTTRIYHQGVIGPTTGTTNFSTYSPTVYIGVRTASSFGHEGSLDDIRIYNRALSADECYRLYTQSRFGYPYALNRIRPGIAASVAGGGGATNSHAFNRNRFRQRTLVRM